MKKRRFLSLLLAFSLLFTCTACKSNSKKDTEKPTMTLIGHASVKIKTSEGKVIYIDPYATGDYSEPADLILVTHNHDDHNQVGLITTKDTTKTITNDEAQIDGVYQTIEEDGIKIEAVPAENSNHPRNFGVGYIITFDGISVYHSGDTNMIDDMKNLSDKNINYAMYPTDGQYNMSAEEATQVADTVNAKHSIPMHTSVHDADSIVYDEDIVAKFTPASKLEIPFGATIELSAE